MKCRQIIDMLEQLAPQYLAESWDNCGLSYGNTEMNVDKILVALEPTREVINQAIDMKADMIITHHPMIFSPIKTLDCDKVIGRKITDLAKNDIVSYSMHTNMDVAVMASVAADKLGLKGVTRLEVTIANVLDEDLSVHKDAATAIGLGSVGDLDNGVSLEQCSELVKNSFGIDRLRVVGDLKHNIKRIAILPGSGKSYIKKAIKEKADVLITGDIDYHSAVDALEAGICVIDAGHFDTEHFFVEYIAKYLEENLEFSNIQVNIATEKSPFTII